MTLQPLIFLFFTIAFSSVWTFCQPAWTLEQCMRVAKERSPKLQTAKNITRVSELSSLELSTTKMPQLKLNANSLYAPHVARLGYDPAITNGGEIAGLIVVQQSLYDGGIRSLKTDQLKVEIEQRNKEEQLTERDLIFAVRQTFIEILRTQQESKLQGESVQQLSDYLALIKSLVQSGNASYTDVLKTEVQLSTAQIALQHAIESAETSKIALKELIGIPADTVFEITGTLGENTTTASDSTTLQRLEQASSNIELFLSDLELKKSFSDIEITRHEINPVVSLIADAGALTSGDNLKLSTAEREPILGFSIGVSVEIPLFNWGATDLRVQQKQIVSDNLSLESITLRRSFHSEVRKSQLQLKNAIERCIVAHRTIKEAEENFLLTKSKFASGGSLSLEVLAAQQLLTDCKLVELQALADIQTLHARIDQLLTQ